MFYDMKRHAFQCTYWQSAGNSAARTSLFPAEGGRDFGAKGRSSCQIEPPGRWSIPKRLIGGEYSTGLKKVLGSV